MTRTLLQHPAQTEGAKLDTIETPALVLVVPVLEPHRGYLIDIDAVAVRGAQDGFATGSREPSR